MAATISTDTTLRAEFLILESTLDALQDAADFSGDSSVGLHTAAWNDIQRDLIQRRIPLEEVDISDSSVLQHAAHLWVLARLYELGALGGEGDAYHVEATKWRRRYRQAMRRVQIDDAPSSATETFLVRS